MRDLVLLSILPFVIYATIKRPFIGIGLWIWTALFFPNAWVYGMAGNLRYNLLFTSFAILSYLLSKDKPKFVLGGLGALVLLFFAWTTVSTAMSVGLPERSWDIWVRFSKVITLFLFVILVLNKKLHIDFFLWCVVLSVGFYANLEALKFVASGGGHKISGLSGHVLGDRNELAVAFVMTLPICYYLLGEYRNRSRVIAIGLLGTMGLLVAGIIGTQSRGGFIALAGFGAYFFFKSKHKFIFLILSGILILGLAQLVSAEWISRMDTINAADDDASFMGRVVAWKLSFILAMQNPFFGGGFKSLEYFPVWSSLSQHFFQYDWFYTGDALPNTKFGRAAHSIYFQVLGEQGFAGLAIFLACLGGAFMKAGRITRKVRRLNGPAWISSLSTMLQLCLFAFALGGAALSFAYFELFYAIIALLILLEARVLPAALKQQSSTPVTNSDVRQ
ncbi:putative O-glycosylation ligase, exosortase A system-associated [Massilia oculi]|uniref:O-glycosylation ligase, exosortase A system-associated n=1 Tax=Massilia hydrophila TaxID=3044279 RepID=A0ABS7YAA2_9BURK|nr:putative O-glycosylation ligase, exosortase A system-associated [Massilia oculi]MCA1855861.1 putative O-glycosylation ligase, exosortase A system-associated [Massilia oculi]